MSFLACTPRAIASSSRLARRPSLPTQSPAAPAVYAIVRRSYATTESSDKYDPLTVERDSDEVDVCIVGGGPAGLSAAIRLKQLEQEHGREIRVVVLEKGAEVGECACSDRLLNRCAGVGKGGAREVRVRCLGWESVGILVYAAQRHAFTEIPG